MEKMNNFNSDFNLNQEIKAIHLTFISEIDRLMQEFNLSKNKLSEKLGISVGNLKRLFNGTDILDFETIAKIQNAMDFQFSVKAQTVHPKYTPQIISYKKRQYTLKYPLTCHIDKDKYGYSIKSELLDIIGTGKTKEEAERNFCHDFDFIYSSYNALEDSELSARSLIVKNAISALVKKVDR